MKRFVFASFIAFLCLGILSCELNEVKYQSTGIGNQSAGSPSASITEARRWFEDDYLKNRYGKAADYNGTVRTTFWERAFMSKMSNGQDLVVVPVEHHRMDRHPNADTYLWLFKNDQNQYDAKVVEYFRAATAANCTLADFTGVMTVRNWEGSLLNGFSFEKGKSVGLLSNLDGEKPLSLSGEKGTRRATVCDLVRVTRSTCTDYVYKVCVNGNCTQLISNGTFCDLYEITVPQCYWVADFPGQTSPYTGATMLPGNISSFDYENYYKWVGPGHPINLQERMKCFLVNGSIPATSNYRYSLTLYIDEPVYGSRSLMQFNSSERTPGHSYLGMEQINTSTGEVKRLVFGFYVQQELKAAMTLTTAGAWGDDGDSFYDVAVKKNLSPSEFQQVFYTLQYAGTPQYDILYNNCTSFASRIMNAFLNMPDGKGEIGPIGLGITPGALGEDIRTNTSTYGPYLSVGNNMRSPVSTNCN